MAKHHDQLARRSKLANALRSSRRMIYTPAGHEAQYIVDPTALGEFAMYWTAEWLAGMFSLTDFPAEWVAFVQASIRGGWHEFAYPAAAGAANAPFSSVVWDEEAAAAAERERLANLVFSQVQLDGQDLPAPFQQIIEAVMAAEAEPVEQQPRKHRKEFHSSRPKRALPDRRSTTL
jgi:hypothetical protein